MTDQKQPKGDTPVVQEAPQLQKLRDLILEHDAEEDSEGNFVIRFNCAEWMEIARLLDKSASGGVPVGWEQDPQTSASSGAEGTRPPLRNEPLAVVQEAPQPDKLKQAELWLQRTENNVGFSQKHEFDCGDGVHNPQCDLCVLSILLPAYVAAQAPLREAKEETCMICGGTMEDHRKLVQKCDITHGFSPGRVTLREAATPTVNQKLVKALEQIVASAHNGNEPGQTWIMIAGGLIDDAESALADSSALTKLAGPAPDTKESK